MPDEIIEELWRIKDGIARECGYDVKVLVAHLKDKKHIEDKQVVDPRSIKRTTDQEVRADPNHIDAI
ncbi:MAG: hypothetical protein V1792_00130 [Pseudomonadota bacterium]